MPDKIVNHFVLADGSVARYEYDGLANAPDTLKLISETNGVNISITAQKDTQCFIPKGSILSTTNNGSNTHWVTFYSDLDKTETAVNGSNYNSGQTKTIIAPKDIFVITIDGALADINFTVKSNTEAYYSKQTVFDLSDGVERTLTTNINRVYIPAGTVFSFENNGANRWVTFYADEEMQTVAIAGKNYASGFKRTAQLTVPIKTIVIDGYTGTIDFSVVSYPKIDALEKRNWYNTVLQFKPRIDHLFVNDTTGSMTIPHESLAHVRLSKWFGFDVIEANLWKTSDGVFVVNHMRDGKFGNYFVHVDGTTNISDILVSSVTWDWICENVVYNSTIAKYQTRPPRLEEFLSECKKNEIIPLVTADADALKIVDKYMGENNYIAYGASNRENIHSAVIVNFKGYTTKEAILEDCRAVGAPYIYCMSNPTYFTDEQLLDIADSLHAEGYLLGTAYDDEYFDKYQALGFDQFGATNSINRLTCGDIQLDAIINFNSFSFSGCTEVNGVLEYSEDGTLSPNIDDVTHGVVAVDIEIEYEGTVTFPAYGIRRLPFERTNQTKGSAYTTYVGINRGTVLQLSVSSGTKIYNILYTVKYR